jgi:DNA-binding response OmpR family regulator
MVETRPGGPHTRGMRRIVPAASHLRIAVIDRDNDFLGVIAEHVRRLEWTFVVHRGPVTGTTLLGGRPHAVLVDVGLFGPHWDDWLARQPASVPELGVLVCTGRSTVGQRVRGLQVGADDWITKPCHPEEVIARLQAIVRSKHSDWGDVGVSLPRAGNLEVRPDLFDAFVGDRPAGLTHREFDVLLHLARGRGKVLGREHLYRQIWGYTMARGDRSIDTFVRKIRNKLRHVSPDWDYVHTHKGAGYSFQPMSRTGRDQREDGRGS